MGMKKLTQLLNAGFINNISTDYANYIIQSK